MADDKKTAEEKAEAAYQAYQLLHEEVTAKSKGTLFLSNVKVFIAGVLVPVNSVQVSSSMNGLPEASVNLAADPRLFRIGYHDRVPVQIFVQETMVASSEYVLLFEGYIAEKSYESHSLGRSLTLRLLSFADVFQDVRFSIMSSMEEKMKWDQIASSREKSFAIFSLGMPGLLFLKNLNAGGVSDEPVTRPTDYLANIVQYVEEAGPTLVHTQGKHLHDSVMAAYYSKLFYQLRMDQRFVWLPYFDTVHNGVSAGGSGNDGKGMLFPLLYGMQKDNAPLDMFRAVLNNYMQDMNAMELLQMLIHEMEYDFCVFASPAYFNFPNSEDATSGSQSVTRSTTTQDDQALTEAQKAIRLKYSSEVRNPTGRMAYMCVKPTLEDAYPPMCNVMFRSQVQSISMLERYARSPTRIECHGMMPKSLMKNDSLLQQVMDVEMYPSTKIKSKLKERNVPASQDTVCEKVEKYTGPWVAKVNAPNWFNWLRYLKDDEKYQYTFLERFFRRQLLLKQYSTKVVNIRTAFNPYITPGFPGVVFDSYDSGLAFAGEVTAVSHSLSPDEAYTEVSMCFVRTLNKAIAEPLNNPVTEVENITHNISYLTDIYAALLGVPGKTVSGAVPATYATIKSNYANGAYLNVNDPQNNIRAAYLKQRRNIVTLTEYCSLMGLDMKTGTLPGGENCVVKLTSNATANKGIGDFVGDRCPLDVYDTLGMEAISGEDLKSSAETSSSSSDVSQTVLTTNQIEIATGQSDKGATSSDNMTDDEKKKLWERMTTSSEGSGTVVSLLEEFAKEAFNYNIY